MPVFVCDDNVVPGFSAEQLIVGVDGKGLMRPLEGTFGLVDGCTCQNVPDIFQTEIHCGKFGGIDLYAHRRFLLTGHNDLAHAVDLADMLRQHRFRIIVHGGQRIFVGLQRNDQDRSFGRVDLAEGGGRRKLSRKQSRGRVDGGLNVPCGRVDIDAEIELQCHIGRTQTAAGRHLGDAGNCGKLGFQWRRDGAGHGFRTGAGK